MNAKAMDIRSFEVRVTEAVAEAKAGRQEIAAELARLSLEQLAKVPPSSITMLGPRGLEMLVSMRRDIPAGAAVRPNAAKPTPPKPAATIRKARRGWPIWAFCAALLAAGPIFDRCWPFLERMADTGPRSMQASAWPACRRLDAQTDGCLYRTGNAATTLRQLADRLGMPASRLALSNRHLTSPVDAPLALRTTIVVWRGNSPLDR